MQQLEYTRMAEFEKSFWWHKGKLFLVRNLIQIYSEEMKRPLEILEIGCGTGEITQSLMEFGNVKGIDISEEAINFCKERNLVNIVLGDINNLDISQEKEKYDFILALDVLEHIQDDLETMRRAHIMLKKGGYFIVNVPAHKFLWSEHDEALHHKRRYHSVEIKQKLKDTGFEIVKYSYFVTTAFFPIFVIRTLTTLFKRNAYPKTSYIALPGFLNSFAIKVMDVEAKLLTKMKLPIGTTITVVAKKV